MTTIEIIGIPVSASEYAPGQEKAPAALRGAGLAEFMERNGLTVVDRYDDPPVLRYRADRANPDAMQVESMAAYIDHTRRRVGRALADRHVSVVLGGGCAIELGVVAAHLDAGARVGLIYLDLHSDLNVPSSTADGSLSWMGLAHMLAVTGSRPELAGIGPRTPLLRPAEVALFGFHPAHATDFERGHVDELGLRVVEWETVAADPVGEATRLLDGWPDGIDTLLVHFDVDVLDFYDTPLAESTATRGIGLTLAQATAALQVWAADPRFSALTVTELNPDHGEEDGSTLRDFARTLAGAVAPVVGQTPAMFP